MKRECKPWLDPNGKPYTEEVLKEISQNWDQETWEVYLQAQEYYLREKLIEPQRYDELADRQEETIFQRFCLSSDSETQELVEFLLTNLSPKQRFVIEQVFFEGRTEREIARELGISQPRVHLYKTKALDQIKRLMREGVITQPYIGGYEKNKKDAFEKIDERYQDGTLTKNERNYLWALADVGGIKEGDLV